LAKEQISNIIAPIKMRKAAQLPLRFRTWGGRRSGAGRKPQARRSTAHRARPEHRSAHPVHITLRSRFRPLRSQFVLPTLARAMAAASRSIAGFRVVHFSVQRDHVHLIVEANDKCTLSAGVRGLVVRIARQINVLVGRRGRFWADRWHGRALTSPRAARHALRYVLFNFRKHGIRARRAVDVFSSAPYFAGFLEYRGQVPVSVDSGLIPKWLALIAEKSVAPAQTWLLRVGWCLEGLLSVYDEPRS
jgi:REP element-mobilizing transposase RayT